jgi:hypothetical protein
VAAFMTMGDDAERGASEEEDLGNAALRRAGRADPEDVTLGSSQKLRSQGTSTRYGNPDGRCIGQETAGRANGRASNRRQHAAAFCGRPGVHRAKRPAPSDKALARCPCVSGPWRACYHCSLMCIHPSRHSIEHQ